MDTIADILALLRPNIRSLKPYSSARHEFTGEASVFLDANESPFNAPLNRYPDPLQEELKEHISNYTGIDTSSIFLGNGSDEAIDLLIRSFCEPGQDRILIPEPTYGMYQVCADINGVECNKVGLNSDFSMNTEAMLAASQEPGCKLVFLCSPNNPSGNLLETGAIRTLLEESGSVVVLDEAYVDFSSARGCMDLLEDFPNLVILRTLSKAWGLAGIRLGMALAHPELIAILNKVKYPYNINSLSQEHALKVLLKGKEEKEAWVSSILEERLSLEKSLRTINMVEEVFPSHANFLLVRFLDSSLVFKALKQRGVIVRDRSTQLHCENCLRITVGSPAENGTLMETLKQLDTIKE